MHSASATSCTTRLSNSLTASSQLHHPKQTAKFSDQRTGCNDIRKGCLLRRDVDIFSVRTQLNKRSKVRVEWTIAPSRPLNVDQQAFIESLDTKSNELGELLASSFDSSLVAVVERPLRVGHSHEQLISGGMQHVRHQESNFDLPVAAVNAGKLSTDPHRSNAKNKGRPPA